MNAKQVSAYGGGGISVNSFQSTPVRKAAHRDGRHRGGSASAPEIGFHWWITCAKGRRGSMVRTTSSRRNLKPRHGLGGLRRVQAASPGGNGHGMAGRLLHQQRDEALAVQPRLCRSCPSGIVEYHPQPPGQAGAGLAESNDASVVRKPLGHVARRFAPRANELLRRALPPFLDSHRHRPSLRGQDRSTLVQNLRSLRHHPSIHPLPDSACGSFHLSHSRLVFVLEKTGRAPHPPGYDGGSRSRIEEAGIR